MADNKILSLPPDAESLNHYVREEWANIQRGWENGWAADNRLSQLEEIIEANRQRIFERNEADDRYDWRHDWVNARLFNEQMIDFVQNRKHFNKELKELWFEWTKSSTEHGGRISIEALRSMVLVDGAAIIASLAVLSGQVPHPHPMAVTVAKVTVFTSIASLLMMAAGHALIFETLNSVVGRVRGALVGHPKHKRLFAISRYLRRYSDPKMKVANVLIYGSIAVFGISALISSLLLLCV